MLIAVLMAAISFAGTPLRKATPISAQQVSAERFQVPSQKAMTASLPVAKKAPLKMKAAARKAAPRKVASIDELAGKWMLVSLYYTLDESSEVTPAEPSMGGVVVTVTKSGDNTIEIENFTSEAEKAITATVNLEAGTFSIADGQELFTSSYGPILLSNLEEEGAPLTGTIAEDGTIEIDQFWCATIGGDGEYAGFEWSDYSYYSFTAPVNGKMTWTETGEDESESENAVDVYIYQDPENPKNVTLVNFGGLETAVVISMKEDNTFVIESQPIYDGGDTYGMFYTTGVSSDGYLASLTGTGTETALTFDCMWAVYTEKTYQTMTGIVNPATITYTDGSTFLYPNIPDVPAMPANPEILDLGEYDETEGYGYVLFDVPCTDVDGNDIKESLLSYQLFADVEGEITPITFTPELYKNLEEEMTIVPYTFIDNYDFDIFQGYKLIYLNFEYNYDRIGIKSIYTGGGETNETEIQWFEVEKPTPEGDFTFDFNSMDVPTSNLDNSGDITEELTLTEGSVSLTISPKEEGATTPNRFWLATVGTQLRVYSGTLTFEVPEGYVITSIVFNAGKWNDDNAADSGEFGEFADNQATWTGEAQKVEVTIGGNTQLNSILVTVAEGEGGDTPDDELVVLPEGLEPEAWTIEGSYVNYFGAEDVQTATQVAIDGNTIYIQGLSFYFEDAWLKGTIEDGIATFPSGQFVGEDEDGTEYMIGSEDLETLCDIQFIYDAEAKTLTQKTGYILENGDTKTELSYYGYWTNVIYYAGEPVVIDPITPPADLATEVYLFKAVASVEETDDEGNPLEPTSKDYENQVRVGIDGDDLYIQGLSEDYPEGWVKATKNEDGKYVIPVNQFMGSVDFMGLLTLNYYFTATDEEGNFLDAVFTVDLETGTITSSQTLAVNASKFALEYVMLFDNVTLTKLKEIAAVPADPTILEFVATEDTTYPYISFDIPAKSVDGEPLVMDFLAYQIFIVKNDEQQPLILTPELYKLLDEDVSIIPYTFNDDYDIYKGGEKVYLNQGWEEISTWTNIGVKVINYACGETHESKIVWFNGDYDGISARTTTDDVRYFDVTGRAAKANQKGLLIKQTRNNDGTVSTVKVLRK